MTTIYSARIESRFRDSVKTRCAVNDCQLKLSGFPNANVILDVDIAMSRQPGRKCDRVIVVDESSNVFFIPIEFKSANPNFARTQSQIDGCTRFFENLLPQTCKFHPVLVSKRISKHERAMLSNVKAHSKYGNKRIKHVQCNKSLTWQEVKNSAGN